MLSHFAIPWLTVVGHAHRQALVESAVLALVAVFLLDLALEVTLVVLQLQPDGPPEETLRGGGDTVPM